jgi:hypothetical protein
VISFKNDTMIFTPQQISRSKMLLAGQIHR